MILALVALTAFLAGVWLALWWTNWRHDRALERLWAQHKALLDRQYALDRAHRQTLESIERAEQTMCERIEQSIAGTA